MNASFRKSPSLLHQRAGRHTGFLRLSSWLLPLSGGASRFRDSALVRREGRCIVCGGSPVPPQSDAFDLLLMSGAAGSIREFLSLSRRFRKLFLVETDDDPAIFDQDGAADQVRVFLT
ncbi:MAG: hypothetical protein M1541_16760, partial [Acidobacteria bacterium]|nr:hypothetical protein [Acidobacteriota bacterium]